MDTFFHELWMVLTESSIWLLFGFLLAGVVHVLVPREWMLKHLGGKGILPILKASLLGIPLPLCSCSVIPVAAGLREQGASKGASAAFAISTPQTGEESVPLTWGLFGPFFALTRPIVAVLTGLVAGILIDLTHRNEHARPQEDNSDIAQDSSAISLTVTNADEASTLVTQTEPKQTTSCCSTKTDPLPPATCCSSKQTKNNSIIEVFKHGFGVMLVDLAIWLTVGILLAALIGSIVPHGWFEEHIGTGLLPKLFMLVVGIPLYICATSSTPLAFSLVLAGLSPGAALVLLLSGPATNVATMSWLIKDLGVKALVIYLSVIASIALGAGIIFDAFFANMITLAQRAAPHEHGSHSFGYKEIAAVIFIVLMAWALGIKMRAFMNDKGWGSTNPQPTAGGCCSSSSTQSKSSCGCS